MSIPSISTTLSPTTANQPISTSLGFEPARMGAESAEERLEGEPVGSWILHEDPKSKNLLLTFKVNQDCCTSYRVKNENGMWRIMEDGYGEEITFQQVLDSVEADKALNMTNAPPRPSCVYDLTREVAATILRKKAEGSYLFLNEPDNALGLSYVDNKKSVVHITLAIDKTVAAIEAYIKDRTSFNNRCAPPKTNLILGKEYASLPKKYDLNLCTIAQKNTNKNRFQTIVPYDSNAFYDDGFYYSASKLFEGRAIAAQGPSLNLCEDFWKMVWVSGSGAIAMLVDINGCCQYWPSKDQTASYGTFTLNCSDEKQVGNLITRKLNLSQNGTTREITHFQYLNWQVNQAAGSIVEMAAFVKELADKPSVKNPLIVHCQGGVGRTGTLLTTLFAYKKPVAERDPEEYYRTAQEVRKGRMYSIESKEQYEFGYWVLQELLNLDS